MLVPWNVFERLRRSSDKTCIASIEKLRIISILSCLICWKMLMAEGNRDALDGGVNSAAVYRILNMFSLTSPLPSKSILLHTSCILKERIFESNSSRHFTSRAPEDIKHALKTSHILMHFLEKLISEPSKTASTAVLAEVSSESILLLDVFEELALLLFSLRFFPFYNKLGLFHD